MNDPDENNINYETAKQCGATVEKDWNTPKQSF